MESAPVFLSWSLRLSSSVKTHFHSLTLCLPLSRVCCRSLKPVCSVSPPPFFQSFLPPFLLSISTIFSPTLHFRLAPSTRAVDSSHIQRDLFPFTTRHHWHNRHTQLFLYASCLQEPPCMSKASSELDSWPLIKTGLQTCSFWHRVNLIPISLCKSTVSHRWGLIFLLLDCRGTEKAPIKRYCLLWFMVGFDVELSPSVAECVEISLFLLQQAFAAF